MRELLALLAALAVTVGLPAKPPEAALAALAARRSAAATSQLATDDEGDHLDEGDEPCTVDPCNPDDEGDLVEEEDEGDDGSLTDGCTEGGCASLEPFALLRGSLLPLSVASLAHCARLPEPFLHRFVDHCRRLTHVDIYGASAAPPGSSPGAARTGSQSNKKTKAGTLHGDPSRCRTSPRRASKN